MRIIVAGHDSGSQDGRGRRCAWPCGRSEIGNVNVRSDYLRSTRINFAEHSGFGTNSQASPRNKGNHGRVSMQFSISFAYRTLAAISDTGAQLGCFLGAEIAGQPVAGLVQERVQIIQRKQADATVVR